MRRMLRALNLVTRLPTGAVSLNYAPAGKAPTPGRLARLARGIDGGVAKRRLGAIAVLTALSTLGSVSPAGAAVPTEAPLGTVAVIGHRGASYDAPEHTFAAYDRALQADADFLECDLQLTKDGVLICAHDTTVDRTTGAAHTGRFDSFTLAELRTMDFGSWFNTVNPTRAKAEFAGLRIVPFEEQLSCYLQAAPKLRFHLETKAPAEYAGKVEPQLVKVLAKYGLLGGGDQATSPVLLQSFELSSLEVMSRLAPKLPRAYLFATPTDAQQLQGIFPDYVDVAAPTYQFLVANPTFTMLAHDQGIGVHTYTVDDEVMMDRLLDVGVDGIFSNRPDVLRRVVDARGMGVPAADRPQLAGAPGCAGIVGTVTGPVV